MNVELEFEGLGDLVKAFEKAASDEEIKATNKKIVEKAQPVVQRIMSGKIPKSADISKSGRGFGSKSKVSAHAADSIPLEKMKYKGTSASAEVGWDKSDNSDHFYVKFINWHNLQAAARIYPGNGAGGGRRIAADRRAGISSIFK